MRLALALAGAGCGGGRPTKKKKRKVLKNHQSFQESWVETNDFIENNQILSPPQAPQNFAIFVQKTAKTIGKQQLGFSVPSVALATRSQGG